MNTMPGTTRYALEREGHGRFCPEVGGIVGFASATEAMMHAFSMMPDEAHLWHWVPIRVEGDSPGSPHSADGG